LSDQLVALTGHGTLPCLLVLPGSQDRRTRVRSHIGIGAVGSVAGVPRRRGVHSRPVDFLADPAAAFPEGELDVDAPLEAVVAHRLAGRLDAALEGRALSAVCRDAGLNRSTVQDLLAGRSLCDTVTLAKLEATLGVALWPGAEGLGKGSVAVHDTDRSSHP
jgi:hypothetical protein